MDVTLPLEYYKSLVEHSVDLLSVLSTTGEILYESNSITEILGYDAGELMGKNAFSLIRPSHLPYVLSLIPEGLAHPEKKFLFEVEYKHKNGSWKWLECSAQILHMGDRGNVILIQSRDISDRKAKTDTIHRLQKAIDSSGEAVFITDPEGIITYINPSFTSVYGYAEAEVVGKVSPRIIKSGLIPAEGYSQFWATILDKKEIKGEIINKAKDGRLVTAFGSTNSILDDSGKIIGFVSIQRDITDEKIRKKALVSMSERFELLTESMTIGIFSSEPSEHGHFTATNGSMLSIFEAENEAELRSREIKEYYKYPEKRQDYVKIVLEKGHLKNEKIEFVSFKGKSFIANISMLLKKQQDGTIFIDGIIEDVTHQVQNELQLVKISSAVEQSPDSIVITDKDGAIEYVNPFFTQNTGYTLEEAKGQNPRILKSGETQPIVYEQLWKTISEGDAWRGELKNKKKNGDLYWESISISAVKNDKGVIINYVAVKKDITDQKKIIDSQRSHALDLERVNNLMIGRELKMRELKNEIDALHKQLEEKGG